MTVLSVYPVNVWESIHLTCEAWLIRHKVDVLKEKPFVVIGILEDLNAFLETKHVALGVQA
jgi:hypothetical protein